MEGYIESGEIYLKQFHAGLLSILRGSMLLIDVRRRRLQISVIQQRRMPRVTTALEIRLGPREFGALVSDGGEKQSMDDDVGVAANRRREVSVKTEGEAVVEELVARDAAGGEVGGDRHGVSRQIPQDLVDLRVGGILGRI